MIDGADPSGREAATGWDHKNFLQYTSIQSDHSFVLGRGVCTKKSEVKRELVRKSVGSAVKKLKAYDGLKDLLVDASANPHAAGVFFKPHSALYI